jgi:DNA-binding CsgD family transcriptional regulator
MTDQQNSKLTKREREVIALVARGLANEEIAEQLSISTSPVKIYLHQACIKVGARNRAQASTRYLALRSIKYSQPLQV